jgi:hypothetical protein
MAETKTLSRWQCTDEGDGGVMTYRNVTAYLVAVRAWFDAKRRAAMAGEPFNTPEPTLERRPR